MNATDESMSEGAGRYLPWPLPAACLFAIGIVLAALGLSWAWLLLALPAAALSLLLGLPRPVLPVTVLVLALLVPAGFVRYQLWHAQPNPFQGSYGQVVTFTGVTDGRFLRLDSPAAPA